VSPERGHRDANEWRGASAMLEQADSARGGEWAAGPKGAAASMAGSAAMVVSSLSRQHPSKVLGVRTHAGFQRARKSLQAAEEHELILHSAVGAGACDCVAEAPRPVDVLCAGGRDRAVAC
jgi:hypothetical protein